MARIPSPSTARLPNTLEWVARTKRGDYLVQVAWPLSWGEDRVAPPNEKVKTLYTVDGNAYFYTAVDVSRRLEFLNSTRTVVVGIGYPPGKYVYDFRRGPDLTPKAPEYDMPLDSHGKPRTDLSFGEAGEFLDWIEHNVMTYIEASLFPRANLDPAHRSLYGHSYGGIFALNTMYTKTNLFSTYIAASPTVWWNKDYLIRQPEADFCGREEPVDSPVSLILAWGVSKENLTRFAGESKASFERRQGNAEEPQIREYMDALAKRLQGCKSIRSVQAREFPHEDHGSIAVAALQHGLTLFLLE